MKKLFFQITFHAFIISFPKQYFLKKEKKNICTRSRNIMTTILLETLIWLECFNLSFLSPIILLRSFSFHSVSNIYIFFFVLVCGGPFFIKSFHCFLESSFTISLVKYLSIKFRQTKIFAGWIFAYWPIDYRTNRKSLYLPVNA